MIAAWVIMRSQEALRGSQYLAEKMATNSEAVYTELRNQNGYGRNGQCLAIKLLGLGPGLNVE
jgi:hypothetical protein